MMQTIGYVQIADLKQVVLQSIKDASVLNVVFKMIRIEQKVRDK